MKEQVLAEMIARAVLRDGGSKLNKYLADNNMEIAPLPTQEELDMMYAHQHEVAMEGWNGK